MRGGGTRACTEPHKEESLKRASLHALEVFTVEEGAGARVKILYTMEKLFAFSDLLFLVREAPRRAAPRTAFEAVFPRTLFPLGSSEKE